MGEAGSRDVWSHLVVAFLGLWLLSGPATLGYEQAVMGWNDVVVGVGALVFGLMSLRWWWAVWVVCALGLWLLFAPMAFWASDAQAFINAHLVGIGLIVFSVVVPRDVWADHGGAAVPAGWTFNPSSWVQRLPIIVLAWVCYFVARYMSGYHHGFIDWAWDPFFDDGTVRVLESEVSEAFPVSDAGLGAYAYALEALIGCMATIRRWRRAPWVVGLFGILIVPAGVVSIVLIIMQPLVVGYWCTLCLLTAALMLAMACLALPEVAAMVQYLWQRQRAGDGLWRTLWRGGESAMVADEVQEAYPWPGDARGFWRAMVRGTGVTVWLGLSVVLGVWLLVTPAVLGQTGLVADSHHLTGALVVTVAVLAMAEVARIVRLVNVLLGMWVAVGPFALGAEDTWSLINAVVVGVLLIAVSLPRGKVRERYGGWSRWIV